jgi:SRSO17 transposase
MFVGELRRFAKDHGYSSGWVSHKFREKFGVWPNAFGYVNASKWVSPETANWIKSRQIAYARAKAKQQAGHPL